MENITNQNLRKILALDIIDENTSDVRYRLFPNRPRLNYLLIGPNHSGRTSLLFEFAFQLIEKNKSRCLYLTSNKLNKLPHLVGRDRPSMMNLKRIEMVYPKTRDALFKFLASLHRRETNYDLIVLDNFEEYLQPITKETLKTVAQISAILFDTVSYLRKIGCETSLLCSISSNAIMDPIIMTTLHHWFDGYIYLYRRHNDGYVVKTEYKTLSKHDDVDTDAVPVTIRFNNDKISLN